jgi:ATP-dependent Lhr-like helicase
MDLKGLIEILRGIDSGAIRCLAVDTPTPSQFAHELINAMPYAYLDEADAAARRARATTLRRGLPTDASEARHLDQAAIDTVRAELWPDLRDEHELHDLLLSLCLLPLKFIDTNHAVDWPMFYERLTRTGRAQTQDINGIPCWIATERLPFAEALQKDTESVKDSEAILKSVQGWLQILGPTNANALATLLGIAPAGIYQAFLTMEMQGLFLRGAFEHPATEDEHEIEWCERRILQRIHRLTLGTLRKQIEPVTPAVYMRWLLGWQHLAPQTQLAGEEGLLQALLKLEGFEAPAVEWERTLLPGRVANYDPRWLDALCLSGAVGWGRVSPHPAWAASEGSGLAAKGPRRVIPTNAAPITFFVRESADWLPHALACQSVDEAVLAQALSADAIAVRAILRQRGACFSNDLQRMLSLTRQQTQHALWELATAGLASADGFDQLRGMMDPRRKSAAENPGSLNKRAAVRTTAGRWSLLCDEPPPAPPVRATPSERQAQAIATARRTDAAYESAAKMLLCRYGVLFRDLLERESNAPKWRDLLNILRRLEARGEIRGGRFVTGFSGEQFALPEAVESLRVSRRIESPHEIAVAAADPMNLAGIVVPGPRTPAVPGRHVRFRNGVLLTDDARAQHIEPEMWAAQETPNPSALPLF